MLRVQRASAIAGAELTAELDDFRSCRPAGIRCLLPQSKAAVLPRRPGAGPAGQLSRPPRLTEEQPVRDLSRPPPRPRVRPSGRADPRGPSATCRHEAPGRPPGLTPEVALTDRYRSSRSCESASAIGRRRQLARRCRGRRRRRTSSHCATPTPGALRAVERRNVPPVRTLVTRFRPRPSSTKHPGAPALAAQGVVSRCRGRRS